MSENAENRIRFLDCGDNSCHFAEPKGGMRTNGGCRCLSVLRGNDRILRYNIELTYDRMRQDRNSWQSKAEALMGLIESLPCDGEPWCDRGNCIVCQAQIKAKKVMEKEDK